MRIYLSIMENGIHTSYRETLRRKGIVMVIYNDLAIERDIRSCSAINQE
jgi:hypothetical protein